MINYYRSHSPDEKFKTPAFIARQELLYVLLSQPQTGANSFVHGPSLIKLSSIHNFLEQLNILIIVKKILFS